MEREIKKEFSNLAGMIKRGFDNTDKSVNKRILDLRTEMNSQFDDVKGQLDDINSKLSNVAYRFELNELENRFEKRFQRMELKLGLRKR